MLKALKGVSNLLSSKSAEVTQAEQEANRIVERELHMMLEKIKQVPENRLPSPKFSKELINLADRVTVMMNNVGKQFTDLPAAAEIRVVDDLRKKVTLQRYASLVSGAKEVTPFATFYEIHKVVSPEDTARNKELEVAYSEAVKALFQHSGFEKNLDSRLHKKMAILGESAYDTTNMERKKVVVFVENFNSHRGVSPTLLKNASLNAGIQELEAVIYFQSHTAELIAGTISPSDELGDYINHWTVYLNELSAEAQAERMVLLVAADQCSEAYNNAIEIE